MFDCHMHSNFSADSVMDADKACEKAIELGLTGVAFTDHLDYEYPESDESVLINYKEYLPYMAKIKEKYNGRLNVLRSIEVGIQPHVLDTSLEVVKSNSFDYVLASVHIIDGIDPYYKTYYEGKSKNEAYERYLKEILFMITHFNDFDMVGHFEYIIRYAPYVDRTLRYADLSDIFDSILKELIRQGRGFEVNTGTYRNPEESAEYDREVLKRYRELGGELICLGSDAHRLEHIGLRFDYFSKLLKDAGFKYTVHFENRQPVWDKLP